MPKKPRKVIVKWWDAYSGDWWMPMDAAKAMTPILNESVGYLVNDQPEFIAIAQTYNDANHLNNVLILPRCMIERIMWK